MEKPPLVSVIMSVFNGETELAAGLGSILTQTLRELELIIVDDGSTDGSGDILAAASDPRVRVITQVNSGLTVALNRAATTARGEYLARMDVGDYSLPERLEKQLDFLERHQEIAACGTRTAWTDPAGEVIGTSQVITNPVAIRRGLLKMNLLSHGSVMIRRSAFEEAGGYREYFRYAQDYDLWLRLSEQQQLSNLEEVLYHWQVTAVSISARNYGLQQAYRRLARESAVARRTARPDPIEQNPSPLQIDNTTSEQDIQARFAATLGRAAIMGGDYVAARGHLRDSLSHSRRPGKLLLLLFSCLPSFIIRAMLRLRLAWLNREGADYYRKEYPYQ
jgi:glycosyltransferase involved in cell wall biosynthesis